MTLKVVEVVVENEVLISYDVVFDSINGPVTDGDFVALAKENLEQDGYSIEVISTATFNVRDP